jgi:glycosyltransferase involved in cell wall biosynthesis
LKRRFRVLHLIISLAPGGAETNLLELLRHFDHERFQHAVAFNYGGVLENEYTRTGIPLLRLFPASLSYASIRTIPATLRWINKFAPDIIHSHLDFTNVVGLVAKPILNCRLMFHFHGNGIVPPQELPKSSMNHHLWYSIKRIYRYSDRAIAVCSAQLPLLKKLGMPREKIALIPNGITLAGAPKISGRDFNIYRFINIANFSVVKNHQLLINAFHYVSRMLPQARLSLVGEGPLRPARELQVQALSLCDKVRFMGVRRDIPDILASSHCFVLSSRWELHPITILEAMRAGLPVIATKVGGVTDTVADGISGMLVDSGDEVALARAMLTLATRPERGLAMGARGLRLVQERFDNQTVAKRIEAEYLAILG